MAKNVEYAKKLLDSLIHLDKETQTAFYEMGRILYSLKQGKLYDLLGYNSMTELVEEELSFTPSTAGSYMRVYSQFLRLKYNKTEALKMLQQFGLRHMEQLLPDLKAKVGVRAMKNKVDKLGEKQLTIWLHEEEYAEVAKALEACGGIRNENGRWLNSSEALLSLSRRINQFKKAA